MLRFALGIFLCVVLVSGSVYGQADAVLNADNVGSLAPLLHLGNGVAYDVAVAFGTFSWNAPQTTGQFVVASGRGLWLFDIYNNPNEIFFETPVALTAAVINGDGSMMIAGGDDGSLRVYGYEHQTDATLPPTQIDAHLYRITDIAFNDNGTHVATADLSGVVRVWGAGGSTLTELSTAQYPQPVSEVEFLNHSSGLIVRSDGRDPHAGMILQSLNGELIPTLNEFYPPVLALTLDAQNQVTALYADGYQRVWNVSTPTLTILPTRQLGGMRVDDTVDQAHEIRVSQGDITAVGGTDGLTRLYRGDAGEPYATLYLHTRGVSALAFSTDGALLFSAGLDRSIKVWDVAGTGELAPIVSIEDAHNGGITALAVTHDGAYLVSGGYDGVIKVWGIVAD